MDIGRSRFDSCTVTLKNVDLEKQYNSLHIGTGTLRGKLQSVFSFTPGPLREDSLFGSGTLTVNDMVADGLPMQKNLIVLLALPGLSHLEFSSVNAQFALRREKIVITRVTGTGKTLDAVSSGWINANGYFFLNITGLLTKESTDSLSEFVRNTLIPAENGRRSFECSVRGTLENPVLTLNKQLVQRAVQNAFESLQNSINDYFK
jgi:hypothetical protein